MKRFLTFILALALMLSLTSCDSTYTSENDDYTQGIIKYQQKETLEYNNDETSRFDDVEYIESNVENDIVENIFKVESERSRKKYDVSKKLEVTKYCAKCNAHTLHKESK